jgi:hypothetical protein
VTLTVLGSTGKKVRPHDGKGIVMVPRDLRGAEALLRLRALRASGDFDAYWHVHLREEQRRNHAVHYADATIPHPLQTLRRVK